MPETTPAETPARRETPRGFAVYDEFADKYGNKVRVQKSSLATDDCVWIFAEHAEDYEIPARFKERLAAAGFTSAADLAELAAMLEPSPHLTVEMAGRLRAALGEFIREHAGTGDAEADEVEELAAAIHEDLHVGCGRGPAELHRAAAVAALRWMNNRESRS